MDDTSTPPRPADPDAASAALPATGPAVPSVQAVALKGLCPRCGAGTLFDGPIRFAPSCRACGLDIAGFDVGDGPAAFLTLILGALVVGLAIWLELALSPPHWVHLIWIPVTIGGVIGSLRLAKGALIALEYRNAAREWAAPPSAERAAIPQDDARS
ncbi:Uncharacterized conserved protein, DUF983 family [Sphingomonas gellani]|uniref:Uncharacterized conserved protein, DUF983 family n=1 Tax=Sphingomonas gellani TaxID=1166340 RepID=A0A1H8GHV6_9SPHN|nr:Uncharacterized conserved protein, DUF983 family [Sphingomonas gellani]